MKKLNLQRTSSTSFHFLMQSITFTQFLYQCMLIYNNGFHLLYPFKPLFPTTTKITTFSHSFVPMILDIIFTSQFKYNITSMPHYPSEIEYSDKYTDSFYEYRHVVLPKDVYRKVQPKGKLLSESEWRSLGIQQSRGWVHYEIHKPEPHILLFRRALGTDPVTGLPPAGFVPPPDEFW